MSEPNLQQLERESRPLAPSLPPISRGCELHLRLGEALDVPQLQQPLGEVERLA
jgi:hypothetical protein